MIERFPDHAAEGRTCLAWIRTPVTVMGFGPGVERLGYGGPGTSGLSRAAAAFLATGTLLKAAGLRVLATRGRFVGRLPQAPPGPLPELLLAGGRRFCWAWPPSTARGSPAGRRQRRPDGRRRTTRVSGNFYPNDDAIVVVLYVKVTLL